jgi:hypothetical protein
MPDYRCAAPDDFDCGGEAVLIAALLVWLQQHRVSPKKKVPPWNLLLHNREFMDARRLPSMPDWRVSR